MELETLTPGHRQSRKRVGRGHSSGGGKTAGRGHKGQKSRSGYSRKAGFEGGQMPLMRRLPKRGFNHTSRHPMAEVNLDIIEGAFEAGDEVTAEALVAKHLVKKKSGGIKLLGRGELTKKLSIKVNGTTASARAKVEAAGGTIEVIEVPEAKAVTRRSKGRKLNAAKSSAPKKAKAESAPAEAPASE